MTLLGRRHRAEATVRCYGHALLEKRMVNEFDKRDKEIQLEHRGLYAEYNLVYDRGTKFGLATGHDANAVLMSLPPLAKWY